MSEHTDYTDYETAHGDTFDSIAFRFYTDEMLSSEIIKANPTYADVLIFEEPTKLKIPSITTANLPASLPPWRR